MKAPTASGFGPKCERAVLGSRPKPVIRRTDVVKDECTFDLFSVDMSQAIYMRGAG